MLHAIVSCISQHFALYPVSATVIILYEICQSNAIQHRHPYLLSSASHCSYNILMHKEENLPESMYMFTMYSLYMLVQLIYLSARVLDDGVLLNKGNKGSIIYCSISLQNYVVESSFISTVFIASSSSSMFTLTISPCLDSWNTLITSKIYHQSFIQCCIVERSVIDTGNIHLKMSQLL